MYMHLSYGRMYGSISSYFDTVVAPQVTIRVLDENDNDPEFVSSVHLFRVSENQTAPVAVGTVPATDRDEGMWHIHVYIDSF